MTHSLTVFERITFLSQCCNTEEQVSEHWWKNVTECDGHGFSLEWNSRFESDDSLRLLFLLQQTYFFKGNKHIISKTDVITTPSALCMCCCKKFNSWWCCKGSCKCMWIALSTSYVWYRNNALWSFFLTNSDVFYASPTTFRNNSLRNVEKSKCTKKSQIIDLMPIFMRTWKHIWQQNHNYNGLTGSK